MKKGFKTKKLFKKLFCLILVLYVLYVFIDQQKTLNSYKKTQKLYAKQLSEQQEYQKELNETMSNIDSKEYIEKIAREKLDMYLPNERVYIDKGN